MNVMRTGLLLAAMTALFLAVGYALAGTGGIMIAFFAALAMNAFSYWNSDKMVLRMHNARPVDLRSNPTLYRMIERLAANAELPMPAVYFIDTDQPNAFATGRNPDNAAVAITRGLWESCTEDEIAGVMAHELAHIQNRDTLIMTVTATFAGAIGFLANFALFFNMGRGEDRPNPIVLIAMMILAPMAAMLVQMAISRTREFSADRRGAEIARDPMALANALKRIEAVATGRHLRSAERNPATAHMFIINPLAGHAGMSQNFKGLFRTHPPTAKRVAALHEFAREGGFAAHGTPQQRPANTGRVSAPSAGQARNRPGASGPWGGQDQEPPRRPGPWG